MRQFGGNCRFSSLVSRSFIELWIRKRWKNNRFSTMAEKEKQNIFYRMSQVAYSLDIQCCDVFIGLVQKGFLIVVYW